MGWNGEWRSSPITQGEWHHAAIVFDAARTETSILYVDGVAQVTFPDLEPVANHTDTNVLGGNVSNTREPAATSGVTSRWFEGTMDQFHLSDRVLTAADIQALSIACIGRPDVVPTITVSPSPVVAGNPGTFSVVVTNTGDNPATGTTITSTLPSEFTQISWTCGAAGGASCGDASGTGDISTIADLPVGGSVTYSGVFETDPSVLATTTSASATATHPNDRTNGNDTASTNVTIINETDVTVLKTLDEADAVAGESVTYRLQLSNSGPSDTRAVTVVDNLPASLQSVTWACTATNGSACGSALGTGSINTTADVTEDGEVDYVISATLDPEASGTLVNTATVSDAEDPNASNDSSTLSVPIVRDVVATVVKQTTSGTVQASQPVSYQIDITNTGSSTAVDLSVSDVFSADLNNPTWSCLASGGASCGAAAGSGNISELVTVPLSGMVTYTVSAQVDTKATGPLSNTATISHPDDDPSGNTSTVSDPVQPGPFDVELTGSVAPAPSVRGRRTVCTFIITNNGPADSGVVRFQSQKPALFERYGWSCSTSSPANTCPAAGEGDIDESFTVENGSTMQFEAYGVIEDTAAVSGNVTCVGTIDPGNDLDGNNHFVSETTSYSTVPD